MRNFKPAHLGEDDWFGWIDTTPGRMDPRTGKLVEATAVRPSEGGGLFDWIETTPGRVNPRTGKYVAPTSILKEPGERSKPSSLEDRPMSKFGMPRETAALPGPPKTPRLTFREPVAEKSEETPKDEVWEKLFGPGMNGRRSWGVGCDSCSSMGNTSGKSGPGIFLWLFLGATTAIALEAMGVTSWSKKA